MNWARHERHELADLFTATGPDAPTLCEGWTTRDLAAHIVIRERRPDAGAGILISPLAGHSERVRHEVAERPWPDLVEQVRSGPRWSPMAWGPVDRAVNTVEFFVHHEDVRRAEPGWAPRPIDRGLEEELWKRVRFGARLMARRSPVGLVLRRTGGDEIRAKSGEPAVALDGPASELLLFVYGRQAHARVEIDATDDLAEQVRGARFGI